MTNLFTSSIGSQLSQVGPSANKMFFQPVAQALQSVTSSLHNAGQKIVNFNLKSLNIEVLRPSPNNAAIGFIITALAVGLFISQRTLSQTKAALTKKERSEKSLREAHRKQNIDVIENQTFSQTKAALVHQENLLKKAHSDLSEKQKRVEELEKTFKETQGQLLESQLKIQSLEGQVNRLTSWINIINTSPNESSKNLSITVSLAKSPSDESKRSSTTANYLTDTRELDAIDLGIGDAF